MTLQTLLQQLIAIPSYYDSTHTERELGDWLYTFLKEVPGLTLTKERIAANRFNICATTPGTSKLLIAVHMDTVQPKQGWEHDQLDARITGDTLSGLGALDTKGGMAALLWAIKQSPKLENVTFLFYCDEEYDFWGMKSFLQKHPVEQIEQAIVIEPTHLSLWNAHRGIVEVSLAVKGKTGHAARPTAGVNANIGLFSVIQDLSAWLETFTDTTLGAPLLNCAYFYGGLNLGSGTTNSAPQIGKEGNNIADYAETVLDIRTTSPELTAENIKNRITALTQSRGLSIESFTVRHDFGALLTDPKELTLIEEAVKTVTGQAAYLDPSNKGFSDGQLIQQAWNIPVVYLGPSGDKAHAPGEWVSIESVETVSRCFKEILHRIRA